MSHADDHLWTDSNDVLYWLRDIPSEWPTIIANRYSEIHTLLPDAFWHHVRSADNPADIASRGSLASDLHNNQLWWKGPSFSRDNTSQWLRVNHLKVSREPLISNDLQIVSNPSTVMVSTKESAVQEYLEILEIFSLQHRQNYSHYNLYLTINKIFYPKCFYLIEAVACFA